MDQLSIGHDTRSPARSGESVPDVADAPAPGGVVPEGGAQLTLAARLEQLGSERRRDDRQAIAAEGDLLGDDGDVDVTVLDVSATGFRAVASRALRIGSWLRLRLGEELTAPEAQVRWQRGREYGFAFAFPVEAEFVAAVLSGGGIEPLVAADPLTPPAVTMAWTDYAHRRCRLDGRTVKLTPLMTEMLSVLLVRRGEAMSGVELARAIWPDEVIAANRMATLHVIIVRLRNRLPGLILSPSRGSYMVPLPA